MPRTTKPSKFSVDPLLFEPEPPVDPRLVKKLFCGRDAELRRALETLREGWDLAGTRSRKSDKRPWVICGESRSGKSHLARRVFAELPETERRLQCLVATGGRLDANAVMRTLFEELRGKFFARILDQRLTDSPLRLAEVQLAKQLVEKIGLFETAIQSATLTVEEGSQEIGGIGLEIGGGTKLATFLAKFQNQRSQKRAVQLILRPPTALDLADVCGIMVETLLRQKLVRQVLVLMDDVDLLEGYFSPAQNARAQRSLLADALNSLHGTPGLDVILTARNWYARARKELQVLVDLSKAPEMTIDELVRIHDRRFDVYAKKHGTNQFLTRDALRRLAADVGGLPGVFLQHMKTGFYQYQNEDSWKARDYEWLLNVFREEFESARDRCAPGVQAIEDAIRGGRLTVDVTTGNPFFGTVLENEFVYQSYYSETAYFVTGLMLKVLKGPNTEAS